MTERIVLRKGNRQRLELSTIDLHVLAFLEQQRMLTVQQLYQVSTILFKQEMKDYSFKNRLRKWEEYKLIRSDFYNNGFDGERFKYVCIGSKGIDVLMEQKILDPTYNKQKIYKFNQKKNIIHYLATQQAALNILFILNRKILMSLDGKVRKYGMVYNMNLFSHPPSAFPYEEWIPDIRNFHQHNKGAYHSKVAKYMSHSHSSSQQSGKTMTIVKPDWIIRLKPNKEKELFINIELDTGSEQIDTLVEKVFNYAILAENNPSEQHYVCFIIADKSFSIRSRFGDGIKRAKNIIERFKADNAVMKRIKETGIIPLIQPLKNADRKLVNLLSKHS
ncbi:replication-relaxation family protein [Ureibacillus aquaedulcis]|uniref:Replication-relaxation family protein n=1 Tax=Ureibacillus aquaedulcis TaxID=3058421 RepID=A0ABT8GNV9_9BACL|nr:replication-relaxation family protein [Ureibacillus sp. BA0131]MDN4493089.1 replication-relaxation family protein [Ureibacillus sp. BA0131]